MSLSDHIILGLTVYMHSWKYFKDADDKIDACKKFREIAKSYGFQIAAYFLSSGLLMCTICIKDFGDGSSLSYEDLRSILDFWDKFDKTNLCSLLEEHLPHEQLEDVKVIFVNEGTTERDLFYREDD